MSPLSIAARAVCVPVPRTVSGAQPTVLPAAAAASITDRASAKVAVSGFSAKTSLPCSIAASAISACAFGIVRLRTVCTSSLASSSATLIA